MAKEWYLLNDSHNLVSGFEEIDKDGFDGILDSELSDDVELYNYDLSIRKEIKALIQDKMTDTKLKTLNRHALVPIGTCKAGMYIKYNGIFWLIVGIVDNNGIFEKAIITFCNYYLTWINNRGEIVQRWANVSSASQYNNGETTTTHYYDRTDQLMVSIPDDDESIVLDSGVRFIIDRRCQVYEKSFSPDTSINTKNPLNVYRLTRRDSVLYDYQTSGYFQMLVYQDEQKDTDGYYVIDGNGYWLCKDTTLSQNSFSKVARIAFAEKAIYADDIYEKFDAEFYDENGNIAYPDYEWEIVSDFRDKLNVQYSGSSIQISCSDSKLINKSFELFLKADGYEEVSITISIKAFI